MKIQLAGYYYSRNLGDAILCDCVRWLLARQYPEAEIRILDLSGRTEFQKAGVVPFSRQHQRKWRHEYNLMRFCSSYTPVDLEKYHEQRVFARSRSAILSAVWKEADCCVFAGGQIMTDWLALEVDAIAREFLSKGRNVYFVSAGTGPVSSRSLRRMYHKLFCDPHVRMITLRDHADFFNDYYRMPEEKKAVPAADCGLWTDEAYGVIQGSGDSVCGRQQERTDPQFGRQQMTSGESMEAAVPDRNGKIGVGFYYPSIPKADFVLSHMQKLIHYLEEQRIPWEAFTNGSGYDAGFGEYVLSTIPEMPENERRRHCRELERIPERPADLVHRIRGFQGILSFRLHSHVIAASLGIPSVAFVWDDKIRCFFRMMGCPERALAIGTDPEKTMRIFHAALSEGWNRELILSRRQESAEMLLNALNGDERLRDSCRGAAAGGVDKTD